MSDQPETTAERPEIVQQDGPSEDQTPAVTEPARVMRIGSMIRQLLDEVRQAPLDDASRARLADIYDTSVRELCTSLSSELADELGRLTHPLAEAADHDAPSEAELRIAKAQLVGWLEGLFHGMQAALFAQQMAARNELEQMRSQGRQLPPGAVPGGPAAEPRPGVYL